LVGGEEEEEEISTTKVQKKEVGYQHPKVKEIRLIM
jgi:hypothetical protein